MAQPDEHRYYTQWAIVTTGGSCGKHDGGSCPVAAWGPYSLREAEDTIATVPVGHSPHIVPFWPRGPEFNTVGQPSRGADTNVIGMPDRRDDR
ncbi:hypothetical protein DFR68_11838 [Nocardia mexicana]|uniref:Uncharacterized protein n=1 Tax=Nocardia mexicana TaxID=279262 RepID=A0A370GJ89_9NOCA|nr:hypothetical protein DFR68_11838 [Nocardia mexicana]